MPAAIVVAGVKIRRTEEREAVMEAMMMEIAVVTEMTVVMEAVRSAETGAGEPGPEYGMSGRCASETRATEMSTTEVPATHRSEPHTATMHAAAKTAAMHATTAEATTVATAAAAMPTTATAASGKSCGRKCDADRDRRRNETRQEPVLHRNILPDWDRGEARFAANRE